MTVLFIIQPFGRMISGISPMPAEWPRISNYLLEKCRIVHQQPEDCWIWWPTVAGVQLHFWGTTSQIFKGIRWDIAAACLMLNWYPVQLPGDVLGLQRLYMTIDYMYRYVICRSIMCPTNSNFEHGHWLTTGPPGAAGAELPYLLPTLHCIFQGARKTHCLNPHGEINVIR